MRKAIVILGMHRSGTSMVSGILTMTGFNLGKNLVQPDFANVKGYFENNQIGQFNDRLFKIMNVNWNDTLLLPDKWWIEEEILLQIAPFIELINKEFESTSFILLKDPRISVLLPFYLLAFEKLNVLPCFIVSFRNPYEVALSLKNRDNLAISSGLFLWMDHTLKAELYSRDQHRIFFHYDQVLADPFMFLNKIIVHFNLEYTPTESQLTHIRDFVEQKMKHQSGKSITENNKLSPEIALVYDLLCPLSGTDPGISSRETIDLIAARFYSIYKFYRGIEDHFEAMLQFETIARQRKSKLVPIHLGHNQFDFHTDCEVLITKIVLNPCNQRTGIVMHKMEITDGNNEIIELQLNYTNADWVNSDGTMVFESECAALTYVQYNPRIITKISVDITYKAFANQTPRFSTLVQTNKINEVAGNQE